MLLLAYFRSYFNRVTFSQKLFFVFSRFYFHCQSHTLTWIEWSFSSHIVVRSVFRLCHTSFSFDFPLFCACSLFMYYYLFSFDITSVDCKFHLKLYLFWYIFDSCLFFYLGQPYGIISINFYFFKLFACRYLFCLLLFFRFPFCHPLQSFDLISIPSHFHLRSFLPVSISLLLSTVFLPCQVSILFKSLIIRVCSVLLLLNFLFFKFYFFYFI